MKKAAEEKVAELAKLRRDGGVLHDYRAPRWDEPFIMEQGSPGERGICVPLAEDAVTAEVGAAADYIPEGMARAAAPELPEMAQYQVLRHYLRYAQMTLGMDLGSDISEGTCTMKYSPKMHEELIRGHKAADVHPWQDEDTLQGLLEIVYDTGQYLKSISGMDAFTLQPGGGSHAVYTNACVMRRYFEAKGELGQRNEMITTIFSHPCDAATPMVAGFKVITVMPDENGYPDLEAFRAAVSEKTVGCMITNPEDTGIYNPQIDKYVEILHDAGALAFTDQANANGILGFARARDAGFDACHFNLHKTFSSPHGCEGPATGAYMCTDELAPYLPVPLVTKGRRAGTTSTTTGPRASAACAGSLATGWASSAPTRGSAPWVRRASRRSPRSQCSTTRTSTTCSWRSGASAGRMPKATAGSTRCATAWRSSRRTPASAPRPCATARSTSASRATG